MAEPKQKDVVDIAIDFFFGALFGDVVYGLAFLRNSGRDGWLWRWDTAWIILFAITMIAGSLAALFRNQFWAAYETYSQIPPTEETVSREAKVILWLLLAAAARPWTRCQPIHGLTSAAKGSVSDTCSKNPA